MRNSKRSNHRQKDHYHGNQQHDQLVLNPSGAIFMCNNRTEKECFRARIFGLPASRESFVRQVKEGMYLFLFNADERKMCGVFKAASDGGMNIVPEAFSSTGSSYPAQVQFNIEYMYEPLMEREFKPAIQEKYFTDWKFYFDLNSDQVHRLLTLFEAKKDSRVHQPLTDRWDLRSSIDSPLNRSYSNQQHDIVSNTNALGQTTLQIQNTNPNPNPNTEGSELLMNSNMNFQISGNVKLPQQLDPNAIITSTHQTYPTHNAGFYQYQYPNDSAQQGILNSSSLCLAKQPYECQIDTFTGNLCNQRMVSCLAYNQILQQQPQSSLLCVNANNKRVMLSGYNPLNLSSSQPVQVHASNPSYPEDIVMGDMSSNFHSGSHLQGHFYNGTPQNDYNLGINQDVGLVSTFKTSQSENPISCQNPSMISGFYPVESKNQLRVNSKTDLDPNLHQDHSLSSNPNQNSNPNPTLYSDVEQRKSVFSRLAQKPRRSPRQIHSCRAGRNRSINQLAGHRVHQSRHEHELNKADKPVSNKWVIPDRELVHIHELNDSATEAGPNPSDRVDRIDVDPTTDMVPDEIPISLVNFKRRSGGNTSNTPPSGEKMKRRLIRPSLELEDEDSDLRALKGQKQKVTVFFDKQSEECCSVSNKSAYNGENVVITDAVNVEGQVSDANSEIADISHGPLCINSQSKGPDSNIKAESLGSSTGECRDENNDILVMLEIESPRQKNDLEDSHGALCNTEIFLERLAEKIDLECVSETNGAGSQKILISGYEGLDTYQLEQKRLNKDNTCSSIGQMDSLVLDEKTEKKNHVPSPEPIFSEPKVEFTDNCVLDFEPDNLTISVHVYKQEINLAEKLSHKELHNPVEEFIALEPDPDNY